MTVEYVDLKEHLTVAEAIERIRRVGVDSETINICYVLDAQRKIGVSMSSSLLMVPQKSVTAIIGIKKIKGN
jgi:magnesium transporter